MTRRRNNRLTWHHHGALFHQASTGREPFFRLALFVNQLKRIRRNLERIKTPGGSIPRVSPVVVVVTVENTRAQELGTRRNASRADRRSDPGAVRLAGEASLHFARSVRLIPKYLYARLTAYAPFDSQQDPLSRSMLDVLRVDRLLSNCYRDVYISRFNI